MERWTQNQWEGRKRKEEVSIRLLSEERSVILLSLACGAHTQAKKIAERKKRLKSEGKKVRKAIVKTAAMASEGK